MRKKSQLRLLQAKAESPVMKMEELASSLWRKNSRTVRHEYTSMANITYYRWRKTSSHRIILDRNFYQKFSVLSLGSRKTFFGKTMIPPKPLFKLFTTCKVSLSDKILYSYKARSMTFPLNYLQ